MAAPDRELTSLPGGPRSFVSVGRAVERGVSPERMAEVVRSGKGEMWVDLDASDPAQFALLERVFGFHPLAISDAKNPATRVKVEEYEGFLFTVIRGVRWDATTDDPYDLTTFNLYFFLGPNYLVTVHAEPVESIATVEENLARNPELLRRGAERLMHAVMDLAVDAFFPVVDGVDDFLGGLEERVFVSFDPDTLREIFAVKRLVVTLRRHLAPQREVFNVLTNRPSALLATDSQIYFRDVYDHVLRINDSLDSYRDLLGGTMEAYLTQVSNRLNVATKGLTVVATVSIPFVVVSGMWGMNFSHIPLSGHANGFWIMLVAQLAMGVVLLGVLRLLKWL